MPEFKIERIRFRWRNSWSATTVYIKDDVVRFGAKVYVCLVAHTASVNFYTDFDNATPKWSQMLDGQSWTGDWTPSTFYKINDIAKLGSTLWICLEGHTSNADAEDGLSGDEAKWTVFAEGENWRGVWLPSTAYSKGDLIRYNGQLYLCAVYHVSATVLEGLELDLPNWTLYTRNLDYRIEWSPNTRYKADELVKYGGIVYRVISGHQSTVNNSYVNPTYTSNTVAGTGAAFTVYRIGNTYYVQFTNVGVDYSASEQITVLGTQLGGFTPANNLIITILSVETDGAIINYSVTGTALVTADGLEADIEKFETVISGIEYKGSYTQYTRYKKNDIVKYGGSSLWICTDTQDEGAFAASAVMDETKWDIWLPGLGFEAVWSETTYYQQGDVVMYGGYSYVCLVSNFNVLPTVAVDSSSAWQLLVPGYRLRGDWQEDDSTAATRYLTGDVVRSGGNLYIAVQDNAGSLPLEETAYDVGTDTPQPWQLLVTGKRWRGPWYEVDPITQLNRFYYPGDVVTVAGTTFACVEYHEADISAAKPTLDLESEAVGPLWVKLAQGGVGNVLEHVGDIKTIGDDSVTFAVPIGSAGESLQISNNIPDWRPQDTISKVFYVSMEGVDSLTRGTTIQTAFRTVKFACDFVNADKLGRTPATIFIKTGIYEEILPINVPYDTALVGDELRSTIIQPADGYEDEDMFRVNNGSGIRNMTLKGLYGTLGPLNQYLTRRPSGGAFVSLNPGNSPSDSTAWITSKSPYVQNVSTFGDGCVGMKIDGNLHNGGNKSIVANDFTQIISNGIGYWAVGEGKSELVSVFTYYCHIGYLAEDGGKLRATNGNNSYGTYGSVAEGFSLAETPITAQVDNRSGEALINSVYNDENQIFCFGFSHTGQDYTAATVSITGSGAGAAAYIGYDNTRYQSISEVRMTDPLDSGITGGISYTSLTGNSRGGDTTSLLLANQYEPEYEKTCTATLAAPVNTITVQNIIDMQVGDAIIFPGAMFGGISPDTIYYVQALLSANTIRISATQGGAVLALTTAIGSAYFVSAEIVGQRIQILEGTGRGQFAVISYYDHPLKEIDVVRQFDSQPGFEHLLGGLAIEPILDESTKYSIEPLLTFSDPPYSVSTITLPTSAIWGVVGSARFGSTNVTVVLSNTGGYFTTNGSTWTACTGLAPVNYLYTARSSTHLLAISNNAISGTTTGSTWTGLTTPGGYGTFTSIACEQDVFIITTNNGFVLRSVDNGSSWTAASLVPYDGSTPALTHSAGGSGLFIVCDDMGQTYESSNLGVNWNPGPDIGSTGINVQDLVYGNNRFVAACNDNPNDSSTLSNRFYYTLANQATVASSAITVWQPSELPPESDQYVISYSQGCFVAITELGDLAESIDGKHWKVLGTQLGVGGPGSWVTIAGGSVNGPCFIPLTDASTNQIRVIRYGARALGRARINGGRLSLVELIEPGSGYSSTPSMTIVDNSNIVEALFAVRTNNGTVSQPTFTNRGTGFLNVAATVSGDGLADKYQTGKFLRIKNLSRLPSPGDNVEFNNIPNTLFKLGNFVSLGGSAPNIFGTLRIGPGVDAFLSPGHNESITIRQNYSQVRLTGHDFLDIGTGGRDTTNYPEIYSTGFTAGYEPQPFNEVVEAGGGRVFYTSTDQNGNFRVGEQFKVEQSSGIVTLSADFFQLEGLTELALGGVVLGGSGAVIREFSTDVTMAANSDNIVPTQKAIIAYIQSRISGGGSVLNVSSLRAGAIQVQNDTIFNVGGETIQMQVGVNFKQGVKGSILALNYFLGGVASTELNEGDAVSVIDPSNGYGS